MKPLVVLLIVFLGVILFMNNKYGKADLDLAGRIAMAAMLIFTAPAHFFYKKGMRSMVPYFVPFKKKVVLLSGIIQIVLAAGILIPLVQNLSALLLVLFLIVLLPANVNAAIKRVDYEDRTVKGSGPVYLWFRIPLQVFFIGWVYYFAVI